MTLDQFRPAVSGVLSPSVRLAQRLGLTPNGVSVIAFVVAVVGAVAFAAAPRVDRLLYLGGAVGVVLNGWLDLVDGELARETDTPICFDVGHAYMEGDNKAIKRFLRRYGDRISHLHCHDVRRRGDTHLPVGAGEVDYDLVESELGGFDGTVALEVFTDDETLLLDSAERIAERFGADF